MTNSEFADHITVVHPGKCIIMVMLCNRIYIIRHCIKWSYFTYNFVRLFPKFTSCLQSFMTPAHHFWTVIIAKSSKCCGKRNVMNWHFGKSLNSAEYRVIGDFSATHSTANAESVRAQFDAPATFNETAEPGGSTGCRYILGRRNVKVVRSARLWHWPAYTAVNATGRIKKI